MPLSAVTALITSNTGLLLQVE